MTRLIASLAIVSVLLTACSEPVKLLPENSAVTPESPSTPSVIGEQSSSPAEGTRFFCEDGVIYDSVLTFSDRASEDALASRIFFDDPARPGFLLTNIRSPLILRTTSKTAEIIFQAASLSGRVGEPMRKQGVYVAEIDLVSRTAQARLLGTASSIPSEALRLATRSSIRLRAFGLAAAQQDGAPRVLVPSRDGYRVLELEGDANRELGFIPCPPSVCWNPRGVGEEIWFTSLNGDSGKFIIRAFSVETGYPALPFPALGEKAEQFPTGGATADGSWLEESSQGFFLGIREKSSSAYLELPSSVRGYLPSSVILSQWNGLGETAILATPSPNGHEQLWAVTIDRAATRVNPHREIPMPASARLAEFIAAGPDVLYATFRFGKTAGSTKLLRFVPEDQGWQALTRGTCENPSVGRYHE